MNERERAAWNSRPLTVTTSTHCPECNTLRPDPDVKRRTYDSVYVPKISVSITCCSACFEAAKIRAKDEAAKSYAGVVIC